MQFPKVMTGILMSSINLAALQTLGPPIGKAHKLKLVVLLPHFSILHSVRKRTGTVLHKDLAFPEEAIEEAILREETPLNVSCGNSANCGVDTVPAR